MGPETGSAHEQVLAEAPSTPMQLGAQTLLRLRVRTAVGLANPRRRIGCEFRVRNPLSPAQDHVTGLSHGPIISGSARSLCPRAPGPLRYGRPPNRYDAVVVRPPLQARERSPSPATTPRWPIVG